MYVCAGRTVARLDRLRSESMTRPPLLSAARVLPGLAVPSPAAASADVVVRKDGTRVEGTIDRTEAGYDVTAPDGKVTRLPADKIKSIERKTPATPEEAQRRLDLLRRTASNMSDIKLVLTRYNDFLRQFGKTPQADEARKDMAEWQDRLDRHMTRAGGKWVTPEELGSLREQSHEQAVKARDLVAQGRLREAEPLLKQALEVDPKNASALYLRGVVL